MQEAAAVVARELLIQVFVDKEIIRLVNGWAEPGVQREEGREETAVT